MRFVSNTLHQQIYDTADVALGHCLLDWHHFRVKIKVMEGRKTIFSLMALSLLALGVTGCQSQPVHPAGEAATVYEADGPWRQVESTVLYTPEALAWMDASGIDPDGLAWYSSRNDRLPYVVGGPQSVILAETAVTYSRSHYGTFGGQVRDNSHTHTYRRRIETTVP